MSILTKSNVMSVLVYGLVGGTAFFIDLGTLILSRDVAGLVLPVATAIALLAGLVASYLMQRFLTFRQSQVTWHSLWKYALLVTANWGATLLIIHLVETASVNYVWGKVLATAVITVWNYFIYRFWIFRGTSGAAAATPYLDNPAR
ncbi:GtrA family protein [Agreia sp. COWG]|uniref:GtrA family protein n=1 Tax=Agreia sp. COWG TaxID=2773266 RepID=UPI0019263061|nr:GtrA family protein [Agreia sp. COWG]CAD5993115.1 Putative flippase GtrA (Transmembrane translocase of bactoprenol-linked glucose) [Agreia sp. COWG]